MAGLELLGGALWYVGFVLVINGIWLLGKVDAKDVMMINLFTGTVTFLASFYNAFVNNLFLAWAEGLLFAFTYLWVAANIWRGVTDQRALGWYCLCVAVTTVPAGALEVPVTAPYNGPVLAVVWWIWGALWFTFFLLLGLKLDITRGTGWFTIIVGVLSGVYGFILTLGWL